MKRTVLCYGDSNTHGTPPMADLDAAGRFDAQTRWTCVAAQALGSGWTLIEEGQPGRTTVHDDPIEGPHRNRLRILPAILESHAPIDVVVLMLGTNDLKARFSVPPRTSPCRLACWSRRSAGRTAARAVNSRRTNDWCQRPRHCFELSTSGFAIRRHINCRARGISRNLHRRGPRMARMNRI